MAGPGQSRRPLPRTIGPLPCTRNTGTRERVRPPASQAAEPGEKPYVSITGGPSHENITTARAWSKACAELADSPQSFSRPGRQSDLNAASSGARLFPANLGCACGKCKVWQNFVLIYRAPCVVAVWIADVLIFVSDNCVQVM